MSSLAVRLAGYLDIDVYPEAGAALRDDRDLLSPEADELLSAAEAVASAVGAAGTAARVRAHRSFLERCRDRGVAVLFPAGAADIDPVVTAQLRPALARADAAEAAYDAGGGVDRLVEAAAWWKEVVSAPVVATAYPGLQAALANNAGGVLLRWAWASTTATQALTQARNLFELSVSLTPVHSPGRSGRLSNLGLAQWGAYRREGDLPTLTSALTHLRVAVTSARDARSRSTAVGNLVIGLLESYLSDGDRALLDEAASACAEQCAAANSVPPALAHQWGNVLRLRVEAGADPAELDPAIDLLQAACAAEERDAPALPRRRVDLAIALLDRHRARAGEADLARASAELESAWMAMPAGSPDRPSASVHLALAHLRRYEVEGSIDALDVAADRLADVLDEPSIAAVDRAAWSANLGAALRERGLVRRHPPDLDRATELFALAVEGTGASSPHRPAYLNNLANSLRDQVRRSGSITDLDAAVEALELAASTAQASVRATALANLAEALLERYRLSDVAADRSAALQAIREAIAAGSPSDTDDARRQTTLGLVLAAEFDAELEPGAATGARAAFERACAAGMEADPEAALRAGRSWGTWADSHEWWSQSRRAYDLALGAVAQTVAAQLGRAHKEIWIGEAAGIGAAGARACVKARALPDAVRMVESSRAVLLSEVLERERTQLSDLTALAPDVEAAYRSAARRVNALEHEALSRP